MQSWTMFNFWGWGGSVSQSNSMYANLTVQALANQTACMLGETYRRSFPHIPKNGGEMSGRESPGALWPVPIYLPGYKPEEPGMEGGGRDSGMFSPVLGSLYPVYFGLFGFVCRGREIHVIGWSQKNPQASDTPTSKIFLTLLWRRAVIVRNCIRARHKENIELNWIHILMCRNIKNKVKMSD